MPTPITLFCGLAAAVLYATLYAVNPSAFAALGWLGAMFGLCACLWCIQQGGQQ